jgi:ribokinase
MKSSIVVVGSSNTDMVIKADHLPAPGETILGGTFFMNPGGKGANQAVSAARLGGHVTFICKTGNDIFGRQSIRLFEEEGIDTRYLISDPSNPSGVALITVDRHAENCIVVASGANATLSPEDLRPAEPVIRESCILLMQLEIPLTTVEYVAAVAASAGVRVVLNPAPALELPVELLANVSVLTPNKTEAEMISGLLIKDITSGEHAARAIRAKGAQTVIITLGSQGALLLHEEEFTHIPVAAVEAVDTTAAGDVFNGALCVALAGRRSMKEATEYACRAAAISVTRFGAQSSVPYMHELV